MVDLIVDEARAVLPRKAAALRTVLERSGKRSALYNREVLGSSAMRCAVNNGELLRCIAAANASANAARDMPTRAVAALSSEARR